MLFKTKFIFFDFWELWIGRARPGAVAIRFASAAVERNYETGYILGKRNVVILIAHRGSADGTAILVQLSLRVLQFILNILELGPEICGVVD